MVGVGWLRGVGAWRVRSAIGTAALAILGFVLRWYHVGRSIHQDSLLWYDRTQHFWQALAEDRWRYTYQAPHPGVTMMWLAGIGLKLQGALTSDIDLRGVLALKLLGVIVGTAAAAFTFPLLVWLLGRAQWRPALVLAVLLTTEPVLVQASRMGHLDMGALGFVWLGSLLSLIAYERKRSVAILAGVCFGLAGLTRLSLGVIPASLMVILLGASALSRFRDRRGPVVALLAAIAAASTMFALWPALWVAPLETLQQALTTSTELMDRGRNNSAIGVYGLYWLARSTPELLLLCVLGVAVLAFVRPLRKHFLWLALAVLPYLLIIAFTPKKSVRYGLVALPILALMATVGVEWLTQRALRYRQNAALALAALLGVLSVGRVVHTAQLLPSVDQCTPWPGLQCDRPDRMYFVRDVARTIRIDWKKRQRRGRPKVYAGSARQMAPWLPLTVVKRAWRADYLVIWDIEYEDADRGTLGRKARREYARRGAEVGVIQYSGHVVARIHRHL